MPPNFGQVDSVAEFREDTHQVTHTTKHQPSKSQRQLASPEDDDCDFEQQGDGGGGKAAMVKKVSF